jgi:hypothetical protein
MRVAGFKLMVFLLGVAGYEDGLSGRGAAVAQVLLPVGNVSATEKAAGLLRLGFMWRFSRHAVCLC